MDKTFWENRWEAGQIGFHEAAPHPLLQAHWHRVGAAAGSRVLAPLCGKSHDLEWLADAGHEVIGVELSPLAVAAFFAERGLSATVTGSGPLACWRSGPYTLYCGDFFAFGHDQCGPFDAIYDRAALIALPPPMRRDYAAHLDALAAAGQAEAMFLITVAYPQDAVSPPPFVVPQDEVDALYSSGWAIERITSAHTSVKGAPGTEFLDCMSRRPAHGH